MSISWRVLVLSAFVLVFLFLGWPKPQRLKTSKLPTSKWPLRVTRNANNPPVPPQDEGVLNLVWLAIIFPKSLLAGVRGTRRGNRLHHLFFDFFLSQNLPLKILPKAFPRDLPGTSKSIKINIFAEKSSQGSSFCPFFWLISVFHIFQLHF